MRLQGLCSVHVMILWAAAIVVAGCGGQLQAGPKWWKAEARFFDDGVDLVEDPAGFSKALAKEQLDLLGARTRRADSVAVVDIQSVQTITERHGLRGEYLSAQVVEPLCGEKTPESLTLVSAESSAGFGTLERHQDRLMGRQLLFLRLFERGDGTLGHHFHLSPASAEMIPLVKELCRERENSR